MSEVIHNRRSAAQWEIISKRIDFSGKTVLDAGCGYADILARCHAAGATVTGIDKDGVIVQEVRKRHPNLDIQLGLVEFIPPGPFDMIICFSVLPYLVQPEVVLRLIWRNSRQALIECQYDGDGPGFDFIKNDKDMKRWLRQIGWQRVEDIGKTLVEGQNKYRTVWLCE